MARRQSSCPAWGGPWMPRGTLCPPPECQQQDANHPSKCSEHFKFVFMKQQRCHHSADQSHMTHVQHKTDFAMRASATSSLSISVGGLGHQNSSLVVSWQFLEKGAPRICVSAVDNVTSYAQNPFSRLF